MSTLRVSNIEAKADVSSPSVHEKIKVTNSEGDVLVHIDGATSGISTVGINTTVKTFDVDSNQNIDFVGNLTAPNITVTGNLSYDDVTNIDSVGVVTARSDVSIADKIVHTGDTNTAIRFPAADTFTVETAGNERFRINSAGNTGIASDTPAARLDVYKNFSGVSAGTYAGRVYGLDAGVNETGVRFVTKGTGDLHSASDAYLMHGISNGTTRFVFGANGSVGIGTDNPALRTHIYSTAATDAALIESTQNYATLRFKSAVNSSGPTIGIDGGGGLQFDQKDTSKYISFAIGSNGEKLRITSDGKIGVGVASPEQKLDVVGSAHTVAVFRPDTNIVSAYGDASVVNNLVNLRMPYGSNPGSTNNNGARWGIKFQGRNDGAEYGTDAGKSASIYAVSEDTTAGYNRKVGLSFYTSPLDANQEERLRITSAGDVNIPGGILNLGTADVSSGHINSYELMSFNIDTDNDDTNRYFIFRTNAGTNSGTELMRLTEGGNLGIGGQDPGTGDGGNSNYNNWDIPKLHVRGSSSSGKFHLLGRFHAGNDADATGAQIVIHHENDRGMALQGGRSSGNRSYGAIKSLDNLARESNVMVFTGGDGQGVENIKFYTNGGSTGTNERLSINTHGTVHTGGSTEITQSVLSPDLITRAGVISPLFWRPFGGLTSGPSTSGPGYLDLGTGGVRHNLTDPHLGAGLGGSQFQGGLINSYSQTFSNTASGTTRESIEWNRFRILFRGVCPSSGYSVATVKFRYSTYHYSNGWQDHAGTEWTFTGTEQVRGGRWVVGPWINPSSYFTNWADVPGFGLYYNDNGSGRNFRIAGGVYYQYAYFQ